METLQIPLKLCSLNIDQSVSFVVSAMASLLNLQKTIDIILLLGEYLHATYWNM